MFKRLNGSALTLGDSSRIRLEIVKAKMAARTMGCMVILLRIYFEMISG